ncbi:MAG: universal stress protein [Proteobacteria bacterium]|nr:universal stress protein [Pseudomonadota bacterium]MBU1640019.1 universal stress protein [Pseudomonadota bacterium]
MEKKILAAVDGSFCSLNEVHYLGQMFAGAKDVYLHLVCIVPTTQPSVGAEWLDEEARQSTMSPSTKKQFLAAKDHLKHAARHLLRHGFAKEQVTTSVELSKVGVAADLVNLARSGCYDALLVGRRGIGRLQALFVGSVTKSILEKCWDIPIWVVDGHVDSRKILVPVDGSNHVLKAVDHLGHIFQDIPGVEITLFHSTALFSKRSAVQLEKCELSFGAEWCQGNLLRDDYIFHAPEQLLRENGFDMSNVHRLEVSRGLEPARDIALQAWHKDFGTIVMGRRDPDERKGVLGGVSDRLLANTSDIAIWLIN